MIDGQLQRGGIEEVDYSSSHISLIFCAQEENVHSLLTALCVSGPFFHFPLV